MYFFLWPHLTLLTQEITKHNTSWRFGKKKTKNIAWKLQFEWEHLFRTFLSWFRRKNDLDGLQKTTKPKTERDNDNLFKLLTAWRTSRTRWKSFLLDISAFVHSRFSTKKNNTQHKRSNNRQKRAHVQAWRSMYRTTRPNATRVIFTCTRIWGPKPLKKLRGAAKLQKKISISQACKPTLVPRERNYLLQILSSPNVARGSSCADRLRLCSLNNFRSLLRGLGFQPFLELELGKTITKSITNLMQWWAICSLLSLRFILFLI